MKDRKCKTSCVSGFTNPELVPGLLTENPETVTKRYYELPYIEKNSS